MCTINYNGTYEYDFKSKEEIVSALKAVGEEQSRLFKAATHIRNKYISKEVYLRALIEYSNICRKDCYYCGIRKSNQQYERYQLSDKEVLSYADNAWKSGIYSLVIQSGEVTSSKFANDIERVLYKIGEKFNHQMRVTLSLGEQSREVFKRWYKAGATRYLLRFETSNERLYNRIHPSDSTHSFKNRLTCLEDLRGIGYQVGSGFMMGLPGQTYLDIADDLLFLTKLDVDMVGMGPYLEHQNAPLSQMVSKMAPRENNLEWSMSDINERLNVALNAIAVLRILMKTINIAATTALQSISSEGRMRALLASANVIMPNFTDESYKRKYFLYANKPFASGEDIFGLAATSAAAKASGMVVKFNEWGDSKHYKRRQIEIKRP